MYDSDDEDGESDGGGGDGEEGVRVTQVREGKAAARAGWREGDVVLSIGGRPTNNHKVWEKGKRGGRVLLGWSVA